MEAPARVKPAPRARSGARAPEPPRFNFVTDHVTLLVDPAFYPVCYALLRVVLGVPRESVIYEKRKRWPGARRETSMTFALKLGEVAREPRPEAASSMLAVVQPSEPRGRGSHVRDMLRGRSSHLQHVALRTPDLLAFHRHAVAHGVNFITPLLRDADEDLIQVFSGELYLPGTRPSGVFFEFVQREITPEVLRKIESQDRQTWFRDRNFLGLYGEKEREYRSGKVTPILDPGLARRMLAPWRGKPLWEITEEDLAEAAETMRRWAREKVRASS